MSAPASAAPNAISSLSELNRAMDNADYTKENLDKFDEIIARFKNDANKALLGVVRGNLDAMRQVVGLSPKTSPSLKLAIGSQPTPINKTLRDFHYHLKSIGEITSEYRSLLEKEAHRLFKGADLSSALKVLQEKKSPCSPMQSAISSQSPTIQSAAAAAARQVAAPAIITAILDKNATQMKILDPKSGEAKSACTFHAMQAMKTIGEGFRFFVHDIRSNNTEALSKVQKSTIEIGLIRYHEAIRNAPSLAGGADVADIKKLPPFLNHHYVGDWEGHLGGGQGGVAAIPPGVDLGESKEVFSKLGTAKEESPVYGIVNHLYSGGTKLVWLKEINNESFCAITVGTQMIIFDSHKNEMILAPSKELAQVALLNKLLPNSPIIDGVQYISFTYALGSHTNPNS